MLESFVFALVAYGLIVVAAQVYDLARYGHH